MGSPDVSLNSNIPTNVPPEGARPKKPVVDAETINAMLAVFGERYQASSSAASNPIFTPTTSDMDRFHARLGDCEVPPDVVQGTIDKIKAMFTRSTTPTPEISPEQMAKTDTDAAALLAQLDAEFGPMENAGTSQGNVSGTPAQISQGNQDVIDKKGQTLAQVREIEAKLQNPNLSAEERSALEAQHAALTSQGQNLPAVQGAKIDVPDNVTTEDIKTAMNFLQQHAQGFDFDCADFQALPQNIQQYIRAGYQNALSKKPDSSVSATDTNTGF